MKECKEFRLLDTPPSNKKEDEFEFMEPQPLPHKEVILSFERYKDDSRIDYFFIFDAITGKVERQEIETDLKDSA